MQYSRVCNVVRNKHTLQRSGYEQSKNNKIFMYP